MFSNYYYQVLKSINYPVTKSIANSIANDCVINDDKFIFFDDVEEFIKELSKQYNLYIISNGWPSSIRVLKNKKLDSYFKRIYISSIYGTIKEEKLFDIFLNNNPEVNPHESLYIDDREYVLDKAFEYNFNLIIMERITHALKSKYFKIHSIQDLINYLNEKNN